MARKRSLSIECLAELGAKKTGRVGSGRDARQCRLQAPGECGTRERVRFDGDCQGDRPQVGRTGPRPQLYRLG